MSTPTAIVDVRTAWIWAGIVLASAITVPAVATAQAEFDEIAAFEEIFIVGSRTLGRTADDLPVPVDLIDEEILRDTGQLELGRMLQQTVPSFNFSSSTISDGTDALRPATLRGLGPDQTLVLINGKRRHQAALIHINTSVGRGTAGTDLNAIPAAAIQRIEVLRDGAAAQYGSDAIAGIINIVLKDDDEGGRIAGTWGQYLEGDGETYTIDFNRGLAVGNAGYVNFTLSYRDRARTNRSEPQGVCLYGGCVDTDNNGYLEPAPGFESLEVSGPGRNGLRIGDADSSQLSAVLNASAGVGPGEAYGFITYSGRENESGAFYRNPAGSGASLGNASNPVHPDGFLPLIRSELKDHSINIGYLIEFSFDSVLDVSYTTGRNRVDYRTQNSANYSYANHLRFGENLADDVIPRRMPRAAYAYGLELNLNTLNVDYSHAWGSLNLAAGLEARTDEFRILPGDEYAWRDYDTDPVSGISLYPQDAEGSIQGFNGISPDSQTAETRDVVSVYLDSEYEPFERWLVSAAIRYDDYDGFGDTSNYKLASIFDLGANLTLRGSFSTGFRAPSMQQLYFNNISTQIRGDQTVTVGTFRNDSDAVQAIGVPELKEEESRNIGLGLAARFGTSWDLTVDLYRIDIDDRITISNQLSGDAYPGPLATALDNAGAGAAQFFLNGADTRTRGIDLVSSYTGIRLGAGHLDLTLAANFTDTEVTHVYVPAEGAISTISAGDVFSEQDISIIEEWQPKKRVIVSGKYYFGNFSANLAFNRYGEYSTLDDLGRQTYGAEWLTDVKVNYHMSSAVSFFLSGNNVFDITPDRVTNTGSRGGLFESTAGAEDMASQSVFRYSRRSAPFGFNGAFISAGATYEF